MVNQKLPEKYSKMFPFKKRLQKRKKQVWNILFYPNVPYDNNGSARAVRNLKVKQKISEGFCSGNGAGIFTLLQSVVGTIINKWIDPFETIPFAINVAACKNELLERRKFFNN